MNALPDFSRARVLIAGDVMLDRYWFGDVSRISPEAPVPVVHVKRTEERPGGAANVARNITALGGHATLLAVVGDDEAAASLEKLVREERVTAALHRDSQLSTTVKLRVIGQHQQLLRIDFERAPSQAVLAAKMDEYERLIDTVDAVVLSDYGKGGLAGVTRMIELARKHGRSRPTAPSSARWRVAGRTRPTSGAGRRSFALTWTSMRSSSREARRACPSLRRKRRTMSPRVRRKCST
jgi:rfaE bifunctional protein kinase chain/domain